eukprot:snap_masked-scaffold64_size435223-processed-gene-2.12 protein:Tk02495 transcript:snap_masked-scaffold64_size435223-processed-gene-2.12-mRNA-1 annotation:"poly(adp-ribose) glycohydrolase arh3"
MASQRAVEQGEDPLQERFRGCMLGAVLGDCLGGPLEFQNGNAPFPFSRLKREFRLYDDMETERDGTLEYTDDTAMARQVAHSLMDTQTHLDPQNLARRFVREYKSEPGRGYGESVAQVFEKLEARQCEDPFGPAREQFGGLGSYGNGAAMRIHPVALFCHGQSQGELLAMAEQSARVTHAHANGVNGALLQAYGVSMALQGVKAPDFLARMEELVETFQEDPTAAGTYRHKFEIIKRALRSKNDDLALSLGNDVTALNSVPSAIFSFLRAQSHIEQLRDSSAYVRTVQLAISFGGDTDTIGSMAGAMAGAYYGEVDIPENLLDVCEGVYDAIKQADELLRIVQINREAARRAWPAPKKMKFTCSREKITLQGPLQGPLQPVDVKVEDEPIQIKVEVDPIDVQVPLDPVDPIDLKLDPVDGKLDPIDLKLDPIDLKLDPIDVKLDPIDVKLDPIDLPGPRDPIDTQVALDPTLMPATV